MKTMQNNSAKRSSPNFKDKSKAQLYAAVACFILKRSRQNNNQLLHNR
jgi:hypothetical protein